MRPFATTKIPMHMNELVGKHFRTHPNIQKWTDKNSKDNNHKDPSPNIIKHKNKDKNTQEISNQLNNN